MPDAIKLLKSDHKEVRELLKKLTDTTERATTSRRELLERIEKEVKIHTAIEEEIFYPAFRDAAEKKDEKELFFEAKEEHHVVDLVLPEIRKTDPSKPEFLAKAKVLQELIDHHAKEEEKEMFPKARKLMEEQLDQLGEAMELRKKELKKELQSRKRGEPGSRPVRGSEEARAR